MANGSRPGFLETFGRSLLGSTAIGQQAGVGQRQREEARRAALQLALENTPIDAGNRPELEAEFGQMMGIPTIGMSFRPEPAEPDRFTLGPTQTRFEQLPGQAPQAIARGRAAPGSVRETETQRGITELVNRGFSLEDAQDIQRGRVRPSAPDAFGNIFLVNSATGETKLARKGAGAPEPVERGEGPPAQQPGLAPLESTRVGVGPKARIQQLVSNVIGPFIDGTPFEETVEARQRLGLFNKTVERSLVNNPRFPVAEVGRVAELLPDTNAFFIDPDAARSRLVQTREFLGNLVQIKQAEMEAPAVTSARKTELADQISILRENLALFGPISGGNVSGMSIDQLITVDPSTLDAEQRRIYIERLEEALQ